MVDVVLWIVPWTVFVATELAITPPAIAEGMKKRIAGSQLAVIQGAGHMAPMEQASQVNRAIRQFLQTLGS